jgi:hypothetical protein
MRRAALVATLLAPLVPVLPGYVAVGATNLHVYRVERWGQ